MTEFFQSLPSQPDRVTYRIEDVPKQSWFHCDRFDLFWIGLFIWLTWEPVHVTNSSFLSSQPDAHLDAGAHLRPTPMPVRCCSMRRP